MRDQMYGPGIDGDIPKWPRGLHPPTTAEQAMHSRLWRECPQARWLWNGPTIETQNFAVAVLARALVAAQDPDAGADLLASIVELADVLLLTERAMARQNLEVHESRLFGPLMEVIARVGETPEVRPGYVVNHGLAGV